MPRSGKFLVAYFAIFGALSLVAVIPGGALVVLLITGMLVPLFGAPGFLVLASPTILLYSAALVPMWLALFVPRRRIWRIAAAGFMPVFLAIPVIVAVRPGLVSQEEVKQFAARMSKDDMARPAIGKPKSVDLQGDRNSGLFDGQPLRDELESCNTVCRRLLFNGEVAWVRMTLKPDTSRVTYHVEHRDTCPQEHLNGASIEKAVRDRLMAGDCLIADAGGDAVPDAVVSFTTRYSGQQHSAAPPEHGPIHANVVTVKDLNIEGREDAALIPVLRQTETVADTLALPFYIGSEMHMQGGYNGPTVGRDRTVIKPIDVAQALRDKFGYKIVEISPPTLEVKRNIAEGILSLPFTTNPALSELQQDVLYDVLAPMAGRPALSDLDVDFMRRLIADNRVAEEKIGTVIKNMSRKFSVGLEPLIPVLIDRFSTPMPQRYVNYQAKLGGALMAFSAESLRPYNERLVAAVEELPDRPSREVLTRLAELGSDKGVALVIQRLESRSAAKFAAVAACRASAEAWLTLEPAVLEHLTSPRQGSRLQDDDSPLLLALVRFGKKSLVDDVMEKRGLVEKERILQRLAQFEPGFAPERCGDRL
jgi:hypothetical protein